MTPRVRSLLLEPLTAGNLRLLVPYCTLHLDDAPVAVPAQIEVNDRGNFEATLHFNGPVPSGFELEEGRTLGEKDAITLSGYLEGDIAFEMKVLPSGKQSQNIHGPSKVRVDARRIHLIAESADTLTTNELRTQLGEAPLPEEETAKRFSAHLVFHGPKLYLKDSGSRAVRTNDFLGEATSATFDTHQFSDEGWDAALIQRDDEIHLHIRNRKDSEIRIEDPASLIDRIVFAVAFIHGFQPWPAYKELRIDHRVVERWVSTNIHLKQSWFAPIPERLGMHAHVKQDMEIMNVLPTITRGLGALEPDVHEKIKILLWHVLATDMGDLPPATKTLMLCSSLDGLTKVIGKDVDNTLNEWKAAAKTTGLSWENWLHPVMEVRKRHRDHLSHGRLWRLMETGPEAYFTDYPRLGSGFMTLIAAACGYEGTVISTPNGNEAVRIKYLKVNPDENNKNHSRKFQVGR